MKRSEQCSSSISPRLAVVAAMFFLLATAVAAYAQTFTVLHNFTGGADGKYPFAGLTMDRAGNLYGTASDGGNSSCASGSGCGTVFRLQYRNSAWIFSILYTFNGTDGETPQARVIIGPDGNLYGTTTNGGSLGRGAAFRLQPPPTVCRAVSCPWAETVLHSFGSGSDGAYPQYGDLTFDPAGNIYGTTAYGGTNNCGTVYELSPSNGAWTETILYSFTCGENNDYPYSGVIFDSAGNLYGTASGGEVGTGGVYKLTHTSSGWVESTIYTFDFPGGAYAGLISDSAGNLYGITFFDATVYELSPSGNGWTYQQLYQLGDYGAVAPLTMDSAGNLYSTLVNEFPVEVFRLTPSDGQWTLTGFNGSAGYIPYSNVILDASGDLYATTTDGGAYEDGVVFQITP